MNTCFPKKKASSKKRFAFLPSPALTKNHPEVYGNKNFMKDLGKLLKNVFKGLSFKWK